MKREGRGRGVSVGFPGFASQTVTPRICLGCPLKVPMTELDEILPSD
jgi:hypothetical protein